MKTLVVEDDPSMRLLLETLLRARGHDVSTFADAAAGLEAWKQEPHPLVLLDWMMKGMSGVDLCRQMRSLPGGQSCVIILITARNQPEDLLAALDAGADDYITKPLSADLLIVRLMIAEERVHTRHARQHAEVRLKETHQALEKHHADLLAVLDSLRVGIALIDEQGRLTFLNGLASQLMGVGSDQCLGRPWQEVFALEADDRAHLSKELQQPQLEQERWSLRMENRNGNQFWVELEVQPDPRDPARRIVFFYDVSEVHDLREQLDTRARFHQLIGRSEAMQRVFQQIRDVAPVDATVMIEGETGTGKELAARAIHDNSNRKAGPFIAVNCAGLTDSLLTSQLFGHRRGAFTGAVSDHEGLFESANGGTLFLDEIGDIPPNVQTSLLRVLQEKEVTRVGENRPRKIDVRVLCATHRNLLKEVERGAFRADLLYRIRVARVTMPPIRQHPEDIPLMVASFLNHFRTAIGKRVLSVSADAMRQLAQYPWPGNVRELRSAVEYAVIRARGPVLLAEDLPAEILELTQGSRRGSLRGGEPERSGTRLELANPPPLPVPSGASVPAAGSPPLTLPSPPAAAAVLPRGRPEPSSRGDHLERTAFARRLAPAAPDDSDLPMTEELRQSLLNALRRARGNRSNAARLMGVSRATFYRYLTRAGISVDDLFQ